MSAARRSLTLPWRVAVRAKIVLLAAEGLATDASGHMLGEHYDRMGASA